MGKKTVVLAAVVIAALCVWSPDHAYAEGKMIDDFEGASNALGGSSNVYEQEPSNALALRVDKEKHDGSRALMIKYIKALSGGPYGKGGWCGYYTLLKVGSKYFDATSYKTLTFWVKGAQGGENFKIGVADKHWDEVGDSVKSECITKYLPEGKVTTDWQKATIPLGVFFVDMQQLASIAVCFENDCFSGAEGKGTIYIDDVSLE